MPRSTKKGPFVDKHLVKKIQNAIETNSQVPIKTWSRRSVILPMCVGLKFLIHNGKTFVPLTVNKDMVGLVFGMFAITRFFREHSGDRKK